MPREAVMNGASCLIKAAKDFGVEVCFANPGTTELPLVVALDTVGGMRPVLGLFEGVCTGAADGYARMLQKPAMVLLHLGPGLANGIANLHNAKRAHSRIVTVVGEHSSWHRHLTRPLPWISSLWRRRYPDGSALATPPIFSGRIWQMQLGLLKQGRSQLSSSRLISR